MATTLRILFALLLALSVALPGALERVVYTCSMTGQTSVDCCCETDETTSAPTVTDGCCDVSISHAVIPTSGDRLLAEGLELPSVAVIAQPPCTVAPLVPRSPRLLSPAPARAPPEAPGPPIFIEVCSLLI